MLAVWNVSYFSSDVMIDLVNVKLLFVSFLNFVTKSPAIFTAVSVVSSECVEL